MSGAYKFNAYDIKPRTSFKNQPDLIVLLNPRLILDWQENQIHGLKQVQYTAIAGRRDTYVKCIQSHYEMRWELSDHLIISQA